MKKIFFALIAIATLFTACRPYDYRPGTGGGGYYPQLFQYVEDFDNDRDNWSFADGTNYAYGIVSNGTFKFDYNDVNGEAYYLSKDVLFNTGDDFTLYTRIGSNGTMGLLFGYNANTGNYGYSFTVDYDGYVALYDEGGNGYGNDIQEIVSPFTNRYININGDWNELRLEQRGSRWKGYVNDVEVFNIPAQRLRYGTLGFMVTAKTQGEADYIQADWYE